MSFFVGRSRISDRYAPHRVNGGDPAINQSGKAMQKHWEIRDAERQRASLGALCRLNRRGSAGMTDFLSEPFATLRDINIHMIINC